MSAYKYFQEGAGMAYNGGQPAFKRRLDVPDLIANAKLALTTAPTVAVKLASTGFAQNDTLQLFQIPAGVLVRRENHYVVTGEGATCTIDIGVATATETHSLAANDDGFGAAESIQTAGTLHRTTDADEFGSDNMPGQLWITDGAITILFNHATDTAVVDFWLEAELASAIS